MKTYVAKNETIERKWYIIDAADKPVGRVAVEAAKLLRGKHKTIFTPHVDCGDHVIIVNAAKSVLTGNNKPFEPIYRHSGYPGGIKSVTRGKMLRETPVKLMMRAVKGMLPHNKLGDRILKKLRVYPGADHNHSAQMPEVFEID
ncbi:MAG: 50S ribosomal protein L13 [Armatimonadota bacterium]